MAKIEEIDEDLVDESNFESENTVKRSSKKDAANKDKKVKESKVKTNKAGRKVKETLSELKKVSWPSFSKIVKQTGVVIGVVVFFTVVLFGIDRLLSWLYEILIRNIGNV